MHSYLSVQLSAIEKFFKLLQGLLMFKSAFSGNCSMTVRITSLLFAA